MSESYGSIIEKSLSNFVSPQALIEQQQDIIEQQRKEIQQLQTVVRAYTDNETNQQNVIEQPRKEIQQLQTDVQSWIDDEKNKQKHLAYLSHELRSPVSSMLGFAKMLKAQYYGDLNDKQMQYVDAMVKVGDYMLKLVNNYLDLAKINADKQTLDCHKLPIEEICQSSLAELSEKARQKGLKLDLDLEKELDFCFVDPVRFQQILINLLSNAIKFTDEGSVTLRVRRDGDLLCFAVIDTGEGISAENITKLFKPFPQITDRYESTGLGLALSKQLAHLHDGDIIVTSELGKGSCFTLQIPQYQSIEDRALAGNT
jgi:signal transduction histidine kinase